MRKTEKKYIKAVHISLIILIPVLIYLLSFSSVIYNQEFIESQMKKSGLVRYSLEVNSLVVGYLAEEDEAGLLELEVFNEKEKQHLLDVKKVIHRTFDVLFLLLAIFFALVYYNYKLNNNKNWQKILIYSGMIAVALPIVLYFIPFETLFAAFHNIFFADGSWVFAPGSALIQIYPFDFWHNAAFGLFLRGFVTGWLLIILGFIVGK